MKKLYHAISQHQPTAEQAAEILESFNVIRDKVADALYEALRKVDPRIIGAAAVFGIKSGHTDPSGNPQLIIMGLGCGEWSLDTAVMAIENVLPALKAQIKRN